MKYIFPFLLFFGVTNINAQAPKIWTSGEVYNALEKLNFLGSVLYVAAHPDDENTRLISYFSNNIKARTAYLSLTRGDGGQNLIGSEIRELLGVIRTQELLAARRIDGGEQMFSRANDFGYSKHSDETLEIWDEEKVMSDVVWAIRKFRPDIIINRFDQSTPGSTHGHHTASAILSYAAFDISGDKSVYPDQLAHTEAYQPRRLFFNTSWWFYGSQENFEKADKSDMVNMDIGTYYPILGKSNLEIAAESRSQHKCQGMGNTGSRGSAMEYIKLLKGDMPSENNPFAGINTTWSRIPGGGHITGKINEIISNFSFKAPYNSVPQLLDLRNEILDLPDHYWKDIKLAELDKVIQAALGLYLETVTTEHRSVAGEFAELRIEVTNQSEMPIKLHSISIPLAGYDSIFQTSINPNEQVSYRTQVTLSDDLELTAPYWLLETGTLGMYKVKDQTQIGLPETKPALKAIYRIEINNQELEYTQDIKYKFNSPEDGPIYRPFEISPPVFTSLEDKVNIFKGSNPKEIGVVVTAGQANINGKLILDLPGEWTIDNNGVEFNIEQKGESKTYFFNVTPPTNPVESIARIKAIINNKSYNYELVEIDYNHIPFQSVLVPAEAKFVNLDLHTVGKNIAYLEGAGDDIPNSLKQVGYNVDLINPGSISASTLTPYDAVVVGIRAYNKWDALKFTQKHILEYAKNGGTVIIQYNTSRGLKTDELGPFPLELSRDRITKEEAPINILKPEHPVMSYPNKISQADFDNWVQERGLYFPGKWDEKYTAILSSKDPGEENLDGGLLVANYGDGYYVYTGYSWFRQLPAGVPGAFRIFANMIALGNTPRP